jgi:phosphatidylserine/phosphatidylglycerophosphate/cardiolipin synthase-like enzyme
VHTAVRSSVEPEDAVADFVLTEPAPRVGELVTALETGRLEPSSSRPVVARAVVLAADSLDRTMRLLGAWRGRPDAAARLARALRSHLEVKEATERRGVRAELVWTGHKPPGSPLRNTPQVLAEMLGHATGHVVVLAYSLWVGPAGAGSVLEHLVAASRRGANVTFVVDRKYAPGDGLQGHNVRELRSRWPRDARRPEVYSWGDDDDEIAKLHAKVVVVDRRDVLITSANLTGHGIGGNLELGARLQGRPAGRAHDHVMALIRTRVFRPESW